MTAPRIIAGCLLVIAVAAGALSELPRRNAPVVLGSYRVLAADFHVHSFPLGALLAPWDTVLEAQRQGLDVVAMTGHNHVWVAKIGRWFSRRIGGPTVLVGEEITSPNYHLIAVGIDTAVSWRRTAAAAIDDVHRQGGVAIAAHPLAEFWPAFDPEAMRRLDGAEVLTPIAYSKEDARNELLQFYGRTRLTAIGSSDYHGLGTLGRCRTYVFARDNTEQGILEALRERRTVVFDRDGHAYGDPALIAFAAQDRRLTEPEFAPSGHGFLIALSRWSGVLGLLVALVFGFGAPGRPSPTAIKSIRKNHGQVRL